jgi:hypothetical protein
MTAMQELSCDQDCACRSAVLTAYRELTARSCSDRWALRTCARLYRCHHRDASEALAWSQVRSWVDGVAAAAAQPAD